VSWANGLGRLWLQGQNADILPLRFTQGQNDTSIKGWCLSDTMMDDSSSCRAGPCAEISKGDL
jgi:hypothetical protein